MSTAKDVATQAGALCVGATAFAFGDPSGGTLLATPVTALAAIGITLSAGCAEKAVAKAHKNALKALKDFPEYSKEELERASILLKTSPTMGNVDPKVLAAKVHGQDFETVAANMLIEAMAVGSDDTNVHTIIETSLVAGLQVCKQDQTFTSQLTLELLLETARKQNIELELAEDTNETVHRVEDKIDTLPTVLLEHLNEANRTQLQELAKKFGMENAEDFSDQKLREFLTEKADEYHRFKSEIDAIDERIAGLGNLKAAAQDAADRLEFEAVESLLSMVHETELDIAAQTAELRADNALLRGKVDDAFKLLKSTAESFSVVSDEDVARRYWSFSERFYNHGLRYGGSGLNCASQLCAWAIDLLEKDQNPSLWASAHNSLAVNLQNQGLRNAGEEGNNLLSKAVDAYREALTIYTKDQHPVDWAMTMQNMAIALRNQGTRTAGEEGNKLLGEAVEAYREALTIYTKDQHPVDWATTMQNMAVALEEQGKRTAGEEGNKLLSEAVDAYKKALTIRTKDQHPMDWAMTMQNMAGALQEQGTRTAGEEGNKLLKEAVNAYSEALTIYTKDQHPVQWAMTQENLAICHLEIARHDSTSDPESALRTALTYVESALTIYDPIHMSHDHETATRLRDGILAALNEI